MILYSSRGGGGGGRSAEAAEGLLWGGGGAVVEGLLCSGGGQDIKGWQWLPLAMGGFEGAAGEMVWGGNYGGVILGGRWYSRALTVTEAIGNSRAGPPSGVRLGV